MNRDQLVLECQKLSVMVVQEMNDALPVAFPDDSLKCLGRRLLWHR